jgi:hypothetical protein
VTVRGSIVVADGDIGMRASGNLSVTAAQNTQTQRSNAASKTNTDQNVLKNNNFDMRRVLSGEINGGGKATGYHAEFAADGRGSRMR